MHNASLRTRKIWLIIFGCFTLSTVFVLYGPAGRLLNTLNTHSYSYLYFAPRTIAQPLTNTEQEAIAVPILMYHGVRVKGELGTNTTRENFIAHLEMLKREGYQTISVHEYDLFRKGEYLLPSKPIIITFDDGRKDSFYTVDEVLRKLGFKATIFMATIKSDENDPFFLNWEELQKAKDTGRWEIEAHGKRSHDEVPIDGQGATGRYLTSLIYNPSTGLESAVDFEQRVRKDYEEGIKDLKTHLGIDAKYYAVPLNDYGSFENSNYDKALDINKALTKEYFTLAFIEALDKNNQVFETFYNYKDTDPHKLKRLEVKNMTDDDLKRALDTFAPSEPNLTYPMLGATNDSFPLAQVLYGEFLTTPSELRVFTVGTSTAARTLVGDRGWQNYTVEATIRNTGARETSMVLYYFDEDNYLLLDWDANSVEFLERVDGVEEEIVAHVPHVPNDVADVTVQATLKDGLVSVTFDGVQLVNEHPTRLVRGAPGFGVWDPNGNEIHITSLSITSSK